MAHCDYVATFAFVQPPATFLCEGARRVAAAAAVAAEVQGSEAGASLATSIDRGEIMGAKSHLGLHTAAVLCISFRDRRSQSFTFRYRDDDCMECVHRALHSHFPPGTWWVCYAPSESRAGTVLHSCIDRILCLEDSIPPRIVCQALLQPVRLSRPTIAEHMGFVVVNTLLMTASREFHVGYIPVVLPVEPLPVSQEGVLQQLISMLDLSVFEAAYVRRLTAVTCRVVGGKLVLTDSFPPDDGDQIALLFPTVDVGDVVRVDYREGILRETNKPSDCDGAPVATQGVVVRHTTQNGVKRFDVQCIDGTTTATIELRGLSCYQVISL